MDELQLVQRQSIEPLAISDPESLPVTGSGVSLQTTEQRPPAEESLRFPTFGLRQASFGAPSREPSGATGGGALLSRATNQGLNQNPFTLSAQRRSSYGSSF